MTLINTNSRILPTVSAKLASQDSAPRGVCACVGSKRVYESDNFSRINGRKLES